MALLLLDDAGSTTHLIWRGQELNWGRLSTLDSTSFLGGSIRFMAVDAHIGGIGNSTNTVTALFNGTSIGFYGLPFAADGTSMEAIVDGQSVTFIPGSNDYFGPVYQSPTLSDGLHNVTLVQGLELDFMVVTPGTTTSLTGELMILDDGDQTMTYTGSWTKNSSILASDKSRAPFGGDFHQTTNSLDSATLKFTGSSVSIYGIHDANMPLPPVRFTMDNSKFPTSAVISETQANATHTHFLWFSATDLTPTNHTILIDFDRNARWPEGAKFSLDYILFSPSNVTTPTTDAGATTTIHVHSTEGPMATDTSGSDVSSHTSHRNAIIGGVIGGVVALLVLAFLIFWFRKRIFSRSHHVPGTRTKALINPEEFPPIGPVPVTAGVVEPYSVPYTPDTTSFAASSSGPPTVTSSDGTRSDGSRNRLILQGGSDMTQIYPAEKSPLFKLAHIKEDTPSTSTPDPSSDVASITDGAINERAQRIQGLVNELQQEISASGIMASSTNDITSPPPYEPNNRREPLL